MKKKLLAVFLFSLFSCVVWQTLGGKSGNAYAGPFSRSGIPAKVVNLEGPNPDCGEEVLPVGFYQSISWYSSIAGFALLILGILADKKALKLGLWGLAVPAFAGWVYVNYFVDYDAIKESIFNYNLVAEGALANIAEGEERYKSEHGIYVNDLNKLYSHLAGAHGVDKCVRILEITVLPDSWSAAAKHVSSPEKIYWDGKAGSALKKG